VPKYTYKILLPLFTLFLSLLSGCVSPRGVPCHTDTNSYDTFCYQGYYFGEHKSSLYRLGVIHGCKTANGRFVKRYDLSGSSTDYRMGWERGRATCKLIPPEEAQPGTMRTQYQQSIDERNYYGYGG